MTWILRGYLGVWGTQEEFGEEKGRNDVNIVYLYINISKNG